MTRGEELLNLLRESKDALWKSYIECVSLIMKLENQVESENFIQELEAKYGSQIFDTEEM